MGFFNFFKKTPAATQGEQKQNENSHIATAKLKPYTCARCKKEITDEESQWIGNHRFCSDCAAPPEASSVSKHLKETRDMFICQNCGKELASKYMHKNKICVKCALKMDGQNDPQNGATQNNKDVIFPRIKEEKETIFVGENGVIPFPKQKFSENILSRQKRLSLVVRAISETLSKRYYYITSNDSLKDRELIRILFCSRDKKTLLYVEAMLEPNGICVVTNKAINIPPQITVAALQNCVLSDFGYVIKTVDAKTIFDLINSEIGYEYVPVCRFENLFVIENEPWKTLITVGYDKITKKPVLIEKDCLRNSIGARLISLNKAVDYAKEYMPDSAFVTITEENWETFVSVEEDIIDEATTFHDPLLCGNDYFCVMMFFKEKNGERFPLF